MKIRILLLLAIGSACLALRGAPTAVPADEKPNPAQASVIAAFDAGVAAAEALDLDTLTDLLAENDHGAMVSNGRLTLTSAEARQRTRAGFTGIAKIKYHLGPKHVTMLGADAALLVTTGTIVFETSSGETFTRPFAQSLVFVRQDSTWRVLHSHLSTPRENQP